MAGATLRGSRRPVLEDADDRRQQGAAGAAADDIGHHGADTEIARLCRGNDARPDQRDDLTENPAADEAGDGIAKGTEIELCGGLARGVAAESARNQIDDELFQGILL